MSNDKLNVPPAQAPTESPNRSSNDLSDLKRQRGNVKGRLTQFSNYVNSFKNISPSKVQIIEIQFRIVAAQEYFKRFNELQNHIEFLSSESETSSNIEYVESLETLYFGALALAQCLVESRETVDKSNVNNSKCNGHPSRTRSLPEIKLPTFDGSYDNWLEFKHAYVTMIHTCTDLDAVQKFHYLRSSLSGTALQVISAFEFTPNNYNHAWELLEGRFNNTRLLVQNHVKSLFNMPSLKLDSSLSIRKLVDTVNRNIRALTSLGEPTDKWDTLIIYLIQTKLDQPTERDWEREKGSIYAAQPDKSLKLSDIISFIKQKADMLDSLSVGSHKSQNKQVTEQKGYSKQNIPVHSYVSTVSSGSKSRPKNITTTRYSCPLCNGGHAIYTCFKFLNLSIPDRIKFVDNKRLCKNCLRSQHSLSDCIFGGCKQCTSKHNTLLCLSTQNNSYAQDEQSADSIPSRTSTALHSLAIDTNYSKVSTCAGDNPTNRSVVQQVLLCTALVEIADNNNQFHTARALLDNGSQHCFISDNFRKRLNAPLLQSTLKISGVAHSVTQSNYSCELLMRSKSCDYSTKVKCFVLQRITNSLPTANINIEFIRIPNDVCLADPTFNISSEIDILIGADLFWDILNDDRIRLVNGPYLQSSKFGWLLSGPIHTGYLASNQVQCNFTQTLDDQLKRFWEVENVPQLGSVLTKDEKFCEDLFNKTTAREPGGRFSVRIPLKESPEALGDSYSLAKGRFLALERKLERSPHKSMYLDFMREYEVLGHMTRIDKIENPNFFLCHHGVFKENSSTTKLRVVFDGSAVTSSKKSLNDIQYPGPALQNDIFSILLRFRQYTFVACADVEKMFRQILIQPDQRNLQLVLWREKPVDPLGVYQLCTVTYGTASAPYLSMRCIRQLALECEDDVIARVIRQDFFVDDLCTGHDDYHELLSICDKTSKILASGCFPLRKWTFNTDVTNSSCAHTFEGEHIQNKTLGIGWHNVSDKLHFTTKIDSNSYNNKLTKRIMLSLISQIYDPLGLLAPVVILAKILLQKLWLIKLDWDSPVSADIAQTWNSLVGTLSCLHELRIPRHVMSDNKQYSELHIYTDASQLAYGSCAFVRTYDDNSKVTVRLLCAKSKVAPLKSLTIPRLELCGALVGARLYKKIVDSLRWQFSNIYFWTDSTIVIGWLHMSPHLLKPFIQNRVTEINELTGDSDWLHVGTKDNPADLLSRGLQLDSLISSSLWWNGPSYLENKNYNFTENKLHNESININNLPELKLNSIVLTCNLSEPIFDFNRYSSYNNMKRIGAYVLRFVFNLRASKANRQTGSLSANELNASHIMLARFVQVQSFPDVYNALLNKLPINKCKQSNHILSLNVFLDETRLIRVGGRLSNCSEFSYDKKHPILLCSKHHFTKILVRSEHIRLLHAGPQLLLSILRDQWWPLGARNLVRKTVRDCMTCARFKGQTPSPIMGNLPASRLEPGLPFLRTGVDLAGPILVLNRKGRGARLTKSYICLFVCFLTRAIHLELVSSLSTDDYTLALKRFISRRGKPDSIYSDNGKNFVGAEKHFSDFLNNNSKEIIDFAANNGIKFHFIPVNSAHFGGLWENAVRSCKTHLRRVVGNARLTFEELTTVLTQIEAILNSRPMSPLSSDPTDLSPLTPGHFLIGRPLTAPATHDDLTDVPTLRLDRYRRVEQLRQHFWQRWAKEYVSELQRRTKWKTHHDDIKLDSLVLIKDDNLPPLRWRLGRVTRVFPGTDGISRVAELRTTSGLTRRAFSRICPLPLQLETSESSRSKQ